MIDYLKQEIKRLASLILLKKSNSLYDKEYPPNIHHSAKIFNTGKLIFLGSCIINNNVIIKNKKGTIEINDKVYLRRYSKIKNLSGKVKIGNNTTINDFCIIQSNFGGIQIGNGVRIGPNVKMFAENHKYDNNIPIYKQNLSSIGIIINNNVWIGAGAIILDGVRIGDNTVIGAGSVVTKSFNGNCVIAGNPASIIKKIK